MSIDERCRQFCARNHLLASQYKPQEILSAFLDEMDRGLKGENSSLAMIPSYITVPPEPPKNQTIIVLDAGGTNFRTSVIRFDEKSVPHREYFANNPMPGTESELNKEEFFNRIVEYIAPVLPQSDRLGFCFSYAATIDENRDGTLLYWSKEIKAPSIIGEKILANVASVISKRGLPCPAHMSLLNDTVAALLAGVTATRFSTDHEYVGFILGTGTNTAYIESTGAIKKIRGDASGTMAINCESANFNLVTRGEIDLAFDAGTASPNRYVLEKMVAGAYLGGLCKSALTAALQDGVLSSSMETSISEIDPSDARFIDDILSGAIWKQPSANDVSVEDRDRATAIIDAIVERAALLTAVNMAAPVAKAARDGGKKKFCIAADGSTYHKMYSFRDRAENYLGELLNPTGVEYSVVKVEDGPTLGTAVAGLT